MAINLVKGEIKIILETLTEQLSTISQYQEKIPQIEIDIIMANIRRLYERFNDLDYLNKKPVLIKTDSNQSVQDKQEEPRINPIEIKAVVTELKDSTEEIKKEPEPHLKDDLFDEKEAILNEPAQDIPYTDKEIKPDKIKQPDTPKEVAPPHIVNEVTEDLFKAAPEKKKDEMPQQTEPPQKPKKEKPKSADLFSLNEKETIADKYKETPKSVHEKISAEKNDKTVAQKIGKTSVPNLKSAIGINDKFLFINQLFKGDLQEYNKTIDRLNACTNIDLATNALEDLRAAHNWDNGDEAYQKLQDLVIGKLL
ncbi:MAG TPA: hypothetical protein PKW80_01265 [Bacteroidales bacterium]|nr:hypothetical protein [Bacteroidales bacterium]